MADGTGIAGNVRVEVGTGTAGVRMRSVEVRMGVAALRQPVINEPITVKSTNIFPIWIRTFLR